MNFVKLGEEQKSSGAKARCLPCQMWELKFRLPTSTRSGVRHDTSEI